MSVFIYNAHIWEGGGWTKLCPTFLSRIHGIFVYFSNQKEKGQRLVCICICIKNWWYILSIEVCRWYNFSVEMISRHILAPWEWPQLELREFFSLPQLTDRHLQSGPECLQWILQSLSYIILASLFFYFDFNFCNFDSHLFYGCQTWENSSDIPKVTGDSAENLKNKSWQREDIQMLWFSQKVFASVILNTQTHSRLLPYMLIDWRWTH